MKVNSVIAFSVTFFLLMAVFTSSISSSFSTTSFTASESSESGPIPAAGITVYHTYDEMKAEIFQIAADHSNIVDLSSIGKTYEGRDLWALKISDNPQLDEDEPEVLLYGMHHAREWVSVEIQLYIINFLTDNYLSNSSVQAMVDNREIWIVPMVNPDGRTYDGEDDPATYTDWRKNRVPNYDGTRGVDPNRNYGYMWGGAGASDLPSSQIYRGPYAFSENETSAIRYLARQHEFVFSLSYHSYGQLILYPWGSTLSPTPDDNLLSTIAWGMSDRMTNKAGSPRDYYLPIKGSELYLTSGDDLDWMYGEMGVLPFLVETYPTFTDNAPEVVSPYNGFHPKETKVTPICEDNLGGALYLIEIADNPNQVIPHVAVSVTPELQVIDEGQNRSFQVDVLNDGSQSDVFDLFVVGPLGWTITLGQNSLALNRSESSTVDMWVEVPTLYAAGNFELEINASSISSYATDRVLVHVPYENDVGVSRIVLFEDGQMYPMGNYSIEAEIENYASNQQSAFDVHMELYKIGGLEEQTILTQGFETGMMGWKVTDFDGPTSQDEWHIVNTAAHSGSDSIWIGNDFTGFYSDMTLQMLESPTFNLKRADEAKLIFYHVLSTEANYDYAIVEVGIDDSWEVLHSWSGFASLSFSEAEFSLSNYTGMDDVKIRFRFSSDEHKVGLGWYIDDIMVNITRPGETLLFGPSFKQTSSVLDYRDTECVSWRYKFVVGGDYKIVAGTHLASDENTLNDTLEVYFSIDPGKYRIYLDEGMNLVSVPLIMSVGDFNQVLSTIQADYDLLWKYERASGTDTWSTYSEDKSWSENIFITLYAGWWINVSADTHFDVSGSVPGQMTIVLRTGWNMAGYPTLTDRTVSEALAGVPYTQVETQDPLSPYHLTALSETDYMTTGKGYWIHVSQDAVWIVNP